MTASTETVAEYISAFRRSQRFGPRIVRHDIQTEQQGQYVDPDELLEPEIITLLTGLGIKKLYTHQAEAINLILQKHHVLSATPTASGKSLVYNLPVFQTLLHDHQARALYLFPLKALAQDQLKTLRKMADLLPNHFEKILRSPAAIYDGDTSSYFRKKIRDNLPAVLITNPDMLHLSILPYHSLWPRLFSGLTHVVLDEVHIYRGVFGSHMAWLIRRLQRICQLYGSEPTFILSSATVGNPEELGSALTGLPVRVVNRSTAPSPKKHFILFNPLESAAKSATLLLESAMNRNLRTIVYTQSRKMTELITIWCRKRLGKRANLIASYRAGFLPEDRRDIENRLKNGELLGVIATSALELGIDIGGLDICLLVGYPGSIMATRQRGGRVGRNGRESLVVFIGHEDAMDQHFMRNPDDFFNRDVEAVILNPENDTIIKSHLVCAAAELPLTGDEPLLADERFNGLLEELSQAGSLMQSADGRTWFAAKKYPQRDVSLRGAGDRFTVYDQEQKMVLGEIDGHRACSDCHEGAVYLHMARTWLVTSLDLDTREIQAVPARVDYYTRVSTDKETEILEVEAQTSCGATRVFLGRLRVTEQITGFRKIQNGSGRHLSSHPLDLPPRVFTTRGFWILIPEEIERELIAGQYHFMGSIHALEHGIIGAMPLAVLCDRNDIGGISYPLHPQLGRSAVFVYDGYAGGIGLCKRAFAVLERLLRDTVRLISECGCELGCPTCVYSPKCGSGNRPIDKKGCLRLFELLLEGSSHNQARPVQVSLPTVETKEREFELVRRYGVFDLETKRSAKEVGGWHRAEKMGISIGVVFDGEKEAFFAYEEHEIDALLEHLFSLELVVGFNNKRFDNRVLSGYTDQSLAALPSFDILEHISGRLGYRLSLDRLAAHTLGVKKSADGLQALRWYKEGRIREIREYCTKDVEITRDLFLHGLEHSHLLFANKAGSVVRLPVDFRKGVQQVLEGRQQNR